MTPDNNLISEAVFLGDAPGFIPAYVYDACAHITHPHTASDSLSPILQGCSIKNDRHSYSASAPAMTATYAYDASARHSWLSRDPIGELGGRNLYCAMLQNPINRVDPKGTISEFQKFLLKVVFTIITAVANNGNPSGPSTPPPAPPPIDLPVPGTNSPPQPAPSPNPEENTQTISGTINWGGVCAVGAVAAVAAAGVVTIHMIAPYVAIPADVVVVSIVIVVVADDTGQCCSD